MAVMIGADAAERLRERIGGELYERQRGSRHICVPLGADGYFVAFYVSDPNEPGKRDERVELYLGRDELTVATESARVIELFGTIAREMPAVAAFVEFLSELTQDDVDALEGIENDINDLDDGITITGKPEKQVGARIIAIRRELLAYKRYYEQLDVVLDGLAENENGAFTREEAEKLELVERRVRRLMDSVGHLREGVTQAREAYQAQIDIEQNQIMKVFTVIAAFFLPLTLIVGWYGMNYDMPEYHWKWGYAFVIVLTAAVTVGLFVMFKRKKWF